MRFTSRKVRASTSERQIGRVSCMWYSPSIGSRNDLMNPNLSTLLTQTEHVMSGANAWHADPGLISPVGTYRGVLHVGVDLGTAYTVLVVLDEHYKPIA